MGSFEEAKGKIKETVGNVANNPDLAREGEAQKEKGEAQRDETEARMRAKAHEAEQEVAERTKD